MTEQDKAEDSPPPHGFARETPKSEGEGAPKRGNKLAAGVAVGIGSAALVAALLYAGRRKPKGKNEPK